MTGGPGSIMIAAAHIFTEMSFPSRALAQHVVLIVNGELITDYDIEQRTKFQTLSSHKTPARQEVIEELIDEKLKVQIARRYKLDITDSDVDSSYADMAKRMHLTADQLTQTLAQNGIDSKTLKARVRADLNWQNIIRGKFQSSRQVTEKSVLREIETHKKSESGDVSYDYTLR